MGSTKVHYTLDDVAIAIIEQRAPSPGKRGEWLSSAVLDYDRILSGTMPDVLEGGALELLRADITLLQKQLAAVLVALKEAGRG